MKSIRTEVDVFGSAAVGLLPEERHAYALDLEEPVRRLLLDPARSIGRDDVELVGITEIPRHPIVRQTENGMWFFAADYLADPGLARDGGIAIPRKELARLAALREAGVRPDLIWIAHELPAGWNPELPLPALVPDPPLMRDLDSGLERFVVATTSASVQVARGIAIGLALGVGLAVGVAAGSVALVGLDPVVLGGVRHPDRPVVAWANLAEWVWE